MDNPMDDKDNAERTTAHEWVGRSVLDRDGATLGTVTAVVPDPRGQTSWLAVSGAGVTGFLPDDGADASSGQVHAAVTRAQVLAAPATAIPDRLSEFEAAALRRHYARGPEEPKSGPDPVRLGLAAAAFLGLVAWLVARVRRRPPTPGERLAAAGRTASTVVAHRARELADTATTAASTAATAAGTTAATTAARTASSAGPLVGEVVDEVGQLARRGAHAGAELAGRTMAAAAPLALTAAGSAAGAAQGVAHGVAHGVGDLAAGAGQLALRAADTGQRVTDTVTETLAEVPESVAERVDDLQRTWRKVLNRVTFAVFLGVGYVLGARAGTERYDAIVRMATKVTKKAQSTQGTTNAPSSTPEPEQLLSTTPPAGNTMG